MAIALKTLIYEDFLETNHIVCFATTISYDLLLYILKDNICVIEYQTSQGFEVFLETFLNVNIS